MSSVFTKIIRGEIPSYKVYEDERTFAFLDIHPESRGHLLVVPKVEVDKFYDLSEEDYVALWGTVKKLALHMEGVLGQRTILKIIGTDVPHVHIHLMPLDPTWKHGRVLELTDEEMQEIALSLQLD